MKRAMDPLMSRGSALVADALGGVWPFVRHGFPFSFSSLGGGKFLLSTSLLAGFLPSPPCWGLIKPPARYPE